MYFINNEYNLYLSEYFIYFVLILNQTMFSIHLYMLADRIQEADSIPSKEHDSWMPWSFWVRRRRWMPRMNQRRTWWNIREGDGDDQHLQKCWYVDTLLLPTGELLLLHQPNQWWRKGLDQGQVHVPNSWCQIQEPNPCTPCQFLQEFQYAHSQSWDKRTQDYFYSLRIFITLDTTHNNSVPHGNSQKTPYTFFAKLNKNFIRIWFQPLYRTHTTLKIHPTRIQASIKIWNLHLTQDARKVKFKGFIIKRNLISKSVLITIL